MSARTPVVLRRAAAALLAVIAVLAAQAAVEPQQLIGFLNQSIEWYRQLNSEQQLAKEPADVLFFNDERQTADQYIKLAFDFARSQAQLAAATQAVGARAAAATQTPQQYAGLAGMVAKAEQQVRASQAEVEGFRQQVAAASGPRRQMLESTLSETQAELDLMTARRDTLRNMLQFASGAGNNAGGSGLQSEIEELARTVPAASASSGAPATATAPAAVQAGTVTARTQLSGILGITSDIFALRRKLDALDNGIHQTDSLMQSASELRAPMVATLKQLAAQGDAIAAEPDSTDPKVLAQQKQQLDSLTAQFKQLSASVLPLAKANILLDLYQRDAGNWRAAVAAEYQSDLKALILRLAILLILLALTIGIFEFWRRATFKYVHDPRRRYQFLLLRRILLWFVIIIIVAFAFASELGSVATYAGLLTAGVAVALQNVILAVAGYFFLIGKYGIRVGDRVQVQGVTGDVVEIGLVRLHLMEVGGSGSGARPTGRVVAFSNAIVFQGSGGLFKQIPGTRFGWHEISLSLPADSDHQKIEKRVMQAVDSVFAEYKESMERQRHSMERMLATLPHDSLHPESRLRWAQGGLELVVRYPVELDNAAEIDDRIARGILEATRRDAKLKIAGSVASPTPIDTKS